MLDNIKEVGDRMSFWTYAHGTVTVLPMGRTQEEKEYVLKTALNHLPIVSGSEGSMNVYIIQKNGYSSSQFHDEFGEVTNNLTNRYGHKSRRNGKLQTQNEYILVVDGALRDREFEQTYREFMKWLCRLAKRVGVEDVLVEIKGCDKSTLIRNTNIQREKYSYRGVFSEMFEDPSWCSDDEFGEPNWCEYLLWNNAKNSDYPMMLRYKYFADEENDKEVERRIKYERS